MQIYIRYLEIITSFLSQLRELGPQETFTHDHLTNSLWCAFGPADKIQNSELVFPCMSLVSTVQNTSSSPFSLSTNLGPGTKTNQYRKPQNNYSKLWPEKKNTAWNIGVPNFSVWKRKLYMVHAQDIWMETVVVQQTSWAKTGYKNHLIFQEKPNLFLLRPMQISWK